MADEDWYGLLEVDKSATLKEIQKAYRKKALQCHPDKHKDDKAKVALFLNITKALDVLSDEKLRAAFDGKLAARQFGLKRKRDLDDKSRKLRDELQGREERAKKQKREEEESVHDLQQEIIRLREEGLKKLREQEAKEKIKLQEAQRKKDQLQRTLKVHWPKEKTHTKEGLQKIFGAFGSIETLLVKGENAVIVYEHIQPAITSERTMNDHPVYHFSAILACKESIDVTERVVPTQEDIVKAHEDFEARVLGQLQKAIREKQTIVL